MKSVVLDLICIGFGVWLGVMGYWLVRLPEQNPYTSWPTLAFTR